MTGLGFARDLQAGVANAQNAAARASQREAAQEQVRPPPRRIERRAQRRHVRCPALGLEQGDLSPPTLIGVGDDAATGAQLGRRDRVHGPELHALDPDAFQCSGHPAGWRALRPQTRFSPVLHSPRQSTDAHTVRSTDFQAGFRRTAGAAPTALAVMTVLAAPRVGRAVPAGIPATPRATRAGSRVGPAKATRDAGGGKHRRHGIIEKFIALAGGPMSARGGAHRGGNRGRRTAVGTGRGIEGPWKALGDESAHAAHHDRGREHGSSRDIATQPAVVTAAGSGTCRLLPGRADAAFHAG